MSIAEKLTTIAENEQKVYDAGYDDGYNEAEKADYEAGVQAATEKFWDIVQNNGERTTYEQAFSYWNCEYIRPKYKVVPNNQSKNMNIFFGNPSLKKVEKQYFDLSQGLYDWNNNMNYRTFYNCPNLEVIEDIGMLAGKYNGTFAYCKKLHTIEILRVEERSTFTSFIQCNALKNITIEGTIANNGFDIHWSTLLTKQSLTSIKDALSTTTSGLTITLPKEAINREFGIDVDDETTYTDEFNQWRNSRSNWTFAYN